MAAPGYWPSLEHPTLLDVPVSAVDFVRPDVAITSDGVSCELEEPASLEATLECLLRQQRNHPLLQPGTSFERRLNLHVAIDAPLATVRSVVRALWADGWDIVLVLHTTDVAPVGPATSPPDWLQTELAANEGDPVALASSVGAATEVALGVCAEAASVLVSLASAEQYPELLLRLPDAVEECGCGGLDIDALEHLVVNRSSAARGIRSWGGFALDATDGPTTSDRNVASWLQRVARRP
ncbi:MAG: hypothetical protein R3B99_35315 [Polyangiales bacterium]